MVVVSKEVFDINEALDTIDLTFPGYIPSTEALEFFMLMRLVSGEDFEFSTPKWHYFLVDNLLGNIVDGGMFPYSEEVRSKIIIDKNRIAVMASRGVAKALSLDSKVYTPKGFTTIGEVAVGDSIYDRDGAVCKVVAKSPVFNKPVYKVTLGDGRVLKMSEDHLNIVWKRKRQLVKGVSRCATNRPAGMEEVVMTIKDIYEGGWQTKRVITAKNPIGRENKYFVPSITKPLEFEEVDFPLDEYTVGVILGDGCIDPTGYSRITCHLDDYIEYDRLIPYEMGKMYIKPGTDVCTIGILGHGRTIKKYVGTDKAYTKRVPKMLMHGSIRQRLEILKGLMDTDGTVHEKGVSFCSVSKGLAEDVRDIVRSLGGTAYVTEGKTGSDFGVYYRVQIRIGMEIFKLSRKRERQQKFLQAWCQKDLRTPIESIEIVDTEPTQCIAVSSPTKSFITDGYTVTHNSSVVTAFFPVYCAIKGVVPNRGHVYFLLALGASAQGGGRVMAKAIQSMCQDSKFCNEYFESMRFTETEAEFTRKGSGSKDKRTFLLRTMGISGSIRGIRSNVGAHRPDGILFDDCIPDTAAAYSETQMTSLDDAMNNDAINALKGGGDGFIVLIFTPFHERDPNVKNIINRSYTPILVPICEKVDEDLEEHEFVGAWEEMHPFKAVKAQYIQAKKSNSLASFMLERMLRMSSEEDRMISDDMVQWYDRKLMMSMLSGYSLYITTDFTTTSAAKSDYSAIAVWAVSSNHDYFLLDMCLRRQELQDQYNELFRMVSTWSRGGRFIEVGIEIDGQQKAHVFALKQMMQKKGIYFSFARQKGAPVGREGIMSRSAGGNKLERFRYMLPNFQNMKMYFPEQLKDTPDMKEAVKQLKSATHEGFSGHDDFCDVVSQLGMMEILPGSGNMEALEEYDEFDDVWKDFDKEDKAGKNSVIF